VTGKADTPAATVLVVPCYNEAARLDVVTFASFAQSVGGAGGVRLLFVDDGSTDRTAEVLESLRATAPDAIEVLSMPANGGKAEAVRAGVLHALASSPAAVGFWDADLSTPLDELDGFRAVLDERPQTEMVFGARVNLLGRSVRRKLYRHYIGRIFATVMATALRLPIYDTQCGAKLFRAGPGLVDLFAEPFQSRWIFDVEIIARAMVARGGAEAVAAIIYEQPLRSWYDVDGSKLRLRDVFVVARDFTRIWRRYLRRRS